MLSKRLSYKMIGQEFWNFVPRPDPDRVKPSPDELWDKALEFLTWCFNTPLKTTEIYGKDAVECEIDKMRAPTIQGFRSTCGITSFEWYEMEQEDEYMEVVARLKDLFYQVKFEGAAAGLLNPNIISADLGLVRKVEATHEVKESVVIYLPSNGRQVDQSAPKISLPSKSNYLEYEEGSELDD